MTKRFYISDYVGDGITPETALYPRILALQESPALLWIDGLAYGAANGVCIIYTDNTDAEHAAVIIPASVKYIPFERTGGAVLELTDTVSDIAPAKRAAILDALEARHIPTHGLTLASTIYDVATAVIKRFMLRTILRDLDLSDGLDTNISDIPAQQRQAVAQRLQASGFDTTGQTGTVRQAIKSLMDQDIPAMRIDF